MYCTPCVLCNVGGPGEERAGPEEVCTPSVITSHRLRSAEERGERITTIRMAAEIFPKCATRRKWVLGYVQEGKVLKVVLSIKFIWGRDILYPRPSKID